MIVLSSLTYRVQDIIDIFMDTGAGKLLEYGDNGFLSMYLLLIGSSLYVIYCTPYKIAIIMHSGKEFLDMMRSIARSLRRKNSWLSRVLSQLNPIYFEGITGISRDSLSIVMNSEDITILRQGLDKLDRSRLEDACEDLHGDEYDLLTLTQYNYPVSKDSVIPVSVVREDKTSVNDPFVILYDKEFDVVVPLYRILSPSRIKRLSWNDIARAVFEVHTRYYDYEGKAVFYIIGLDKKSTIIYKAFGTLE